MKGKHFTNVIPTFANDKKITKSQNIFSLILGFNFCLYFNMENWCSENPQIFTIDSGQSEKLFRTPIFILIQKKKKMITLSTTERSPRQRWNVFKKCESIILSRQSIILLSYELTCQSFHLANRETRSLQIQVAYSKKKNIVK